VLFIGEDRIDHTPKDETVTVHVGNAFDIIAERKQTDYKSIATGVWEMEFEITLRNHKDSPITVEVNEPSAATGKCSLHLQIHQDRRLGRPIQSARRQKWHLVLKYRIRAKMVALGVA